MASLWIVLMLTYLLGDALRLFAGDAIPGQIEGNAATPIMWFWAAVVMSFTQVMIMLNLFLSLTLFSWLRMANIIVSLGFFLFNLMGIPYPTAYDNFLMAVGFFINGLTLWYAWRWSISEYASI